MTKTTTKTQKTKEDWERSGSWKRKCRQGQKESPDKVSVMPGTLPPHGFQCHLLPLHMSALLPKLANHHPVQPTPQTQQ